MPTGFERLQQMRWGSPVGGATGSVTQQEMEQIQKVLASLNRHQRKRLTPEQIHNLGVLYGKPLSPARIRYFEDKLNRDPNESYYGKYPEFPD